MTLRYVYFGMVVVQNFFTVLQQLNLLAAAYDSDIKVLNVTPVSCN